MLSQIRRPKHDLRKEMMNDDPGQGTILVADDEPANLDVLLKCLNVENYRVLVAEDGENAVERARRALPDVILMDVLMPRMDGFEACRELKLDESTRHIPVIFMTAVDDLSSKIRAFELGAARRARNTEYPRPTWMVSSLR